MRRLQRIALRHCRGFHAEAAAELVKDDSPISKRCKAALALAAAEPGFRGAVFARCGVAPRGLRTQVANNHQRVTVEVFFAVPLVDDICTLRYLAYVFCSVHTQAMRPGATVELANASDLESSLGFRCFSRGSSSYVIRTQATVVSERFVTVAYKAHHSRDDGPVHMWGTHVSRVLVSGLNEPSN